MKILNCIAAVALSVFAFGQQTGELVIFSNNGEPFYVIMNGIYQNYEPATNVRVQSLTDQFYNTRVLCPNNTFEIQKNLAVKPNYTVTYRLIEKDGEYKLRYFSESPLNTYSNSQSSYGDQAIIVFHATGDAPTGMSQTTTTTTTTSTTSTGTNNGESVNINIQMNENGMNAGIYANDGMYGNGATTTTTYSETTTVTTSSSGQGQQTVVHGAPDHYDYYDCALDQNGFNRLKASIEAESFSDDKLRVAKQAAKNKCMTVAQVKDIAGLFSFSSEKLEFTKAAYTSCQDRENYYEVLQVFDFSSDKEELEEYINSH